MSDSLKIVLFVIGALIIVGIVWHALMRTRRHQAIGAHSDQSSHEPTVNARDSQPLERVLAEPEISESLADEMAKAAEKAVAASRGDAHSAEISFTEPQVNWQEMVKESLETRLKKAAIEPQVGVRPVQEAQPVKSEAPKSEPMSEVVIVNLMAPRGSSYFGRDIAAILEQYGLSHGRHRIYHALNSQAETEFSVALAVEPGYFDFDKMDLLKAPGLMFFMDLHQVSHPKQAFKHMLSTVHEVASYLGGDILDHRRQRLTQASVTEYLARIKGVENYRKAFNV